MMNMAVIFGGPSLESAISIKSGLFFAEFVAADEFTPVVCYLDEHGRVGTCDDLYRRVLALEAESLLPAFTGADGRSRFCHDYVERLCKAAPARAGAGGEPTLWQVIESCDIVAPILHGTPGEDGSVQGLCELVGRPYIGCGVGGSVVCMDKDLTKTLALAKGFPGAEWVTVTAHQWVHASAASVAQIRRSLKPPFFVKAARSGSSVGVFRVVEFEHLAAAIGRALRYDSKVIIEREVAGKEYAVGVIGNELVETSVPAEFNLDPLHFDFAAKYGADASDDFIPAPLPPVATTEVQCFARDIYQALGLDGFARVDCFYENGRWLLNEINTMPGLGGHSVFNRLWEATGVPMGELIRRSVALAVARHERGKQNVHE